MPFQNTANVQGLEWLRAAGAMALAEKLEAHPRLRPAYGELVIPPGAPPATVDAAAIARIAQGTGARFVFSGAFERPDWKLRLTLRLWAVEGDTAKLIGERTEQGDFAQIFELMDRMSFELLGKADRAPTPASQEKLARVPTRDFYAFTLFGRGLTALHGMGKPSDPEKAEKDLGRAVFIDPKFAEAHRLLAIVHEAKGKPARASGQRTYALDLRPDYYAPLIGLVRAAYQAKDRAEGIELARRALAIRPWDLEIRYLLGEMLWEEGNVDGSFVELKRLVAFKPDHLQARRGLVLVYATKGAKPELARELEEITRLDPTDESAKIDLGAAYYELGRDKEAIGIYETIVAKNPKHILALKFLGDMHKASGDLPTAISYYEKALVANRNDPRPYFLLGAAYVAAGDDGKAIRIYNLAQKFPRYIGEIYNNLGSIYLRRQNDPQAIWYLSRAAARRPSSSRAHYNYGLALARTKASERALGELALASQLDPSDVDIQFALGAAYLKVGRLEDAEKAYKECARLDPKHADALHNLQLIEELRRRAKEGEISVE